MSRYREQQYRDAATRIYATTTDDIEVDADATVSTGCDEGAWVQAWVWVYDSQIEEEERHERRETTS